MDYQAYYNSINARKSDIGESVEQAREATQSIQSADDLKEKVKSTIEDTLAAPLLAKPLKQLARRPIAYVANKIGGKIGMTADDISELSDIASKGDVNGFASYISKKGFSSAKDFADSLKGPLKNVVNNISRGLQKAPGLDTPTPEAPATPEATPEAPAEVPEPDVPSTDADDVTQAFKDHIDSRISDITDQIAENPDLKVTIAGEEGASESSIGKGIAKGQWDSYSNTNNIENPRSDVMDYMDDKFNDLIENNPNVKYGEVGGEIPEGELHVWGANNSNFDIPNGETLPNAGGMAEDIGEASSRELGIVSTPSFGVPATATTATADISSADRYDAPANVEEGSLAEDLNMTQARTVQSSQASLTNSLPDEMASDIKNTISDHPVAGQSISGESLEGKSRILNKRADIIDEATGNKTPAQFDEVDLGQQVGGDEPLLMDNSQRLTSAGDTVTSVGDTATTAAAATESSVSEAAETAAGVSSKAAAVSDAIPEASDVASALAKASEGTEIAGGGPGDILGDVVSGALGALSLILGATDSKTAPTQKASSIYSSYVQGV